MNRKGATIKDIAKLAGVSIGTVSRIINKASYGYSQETYEKVQQVIKETGYTPNRVARSLITKRSYTIGYMVDDLSNPFFPEIAKGINQVANEHGFYLLLIEKGDGEESVKEKLQMLYEFGIDGVIMGEDYLSDNSTDYLLRTGLPFVVTDANTMKSCFYHMSIDNYNAAKRMTSYLISKGHRKIAVITGPPESKSSMLRLNGYKQVLADSGLSWDGLIAGGDFSEKGGQRAMEALENKDYTAVFAFNDLMAIGVCRYLQSRGKEVPGDISVAGFDDISLASLYYPAITTMRQPLFEIGQGAMELLLKAMAGEEIAGKKYELTLIERESVADITADK
ncbi:LacI family DNA-binding transcriptional regulator [Lachnospiraceae bacterium 62-35]